MTTLRRASCHYGVGKQKEFIEREKEKARCVCAAVTRQRMDREKIRSVTIFGELFGGLFSALEASADELHGSPAVC